MQFPSCGRRTVGFSIIELLIAIIIIGILVAVIIPVLMNRAAEARVAAAETDLEHLVAAEERAAIDTGYVYRFYVLDDVLGGNGLFAPFDINDMDGIRDEDRNFPPAGFMMAPTRMFIHTRNGQFLADYATIYNRMTNDETAFGWNGPYINVHKFRDINRNDLPEDPWGSEYLLFTPAGIVDQVGGAVRPDTSFLATDIGGVITLTAPFFDRFTILSMGPDGAPGNGTSGTRFGEGDDLFRQFY